MATLGDRPGSVRLSPSDVSKPSWSRFQRQIACDRCRTRKKKCDKVRPICGGCRRTGSECRVLNPKRTSSPRYPTSYVQSLENHIARLENSISTPASDPSVTSDPDFMCQTHNPAISHEPIGVSLGEGGISSWDPALLDPSSMAELVDSFYYSDWANNPPSYCENSSAAVQIEQEVDPAYAPLPTAVENDKSSDVDRPVEVERLEGSLSPARGLLGGGVSGTSEPDTQFVMPSPSNVLSDLTARTESNQISENYVHQYFTNSHPLLSFIQDEQWIMFYAKSQAVRDGGLPNGWQCYFVDMVRAIGGLIAQHLDPISNHLARAKHFHDLAMGKYHSYDIQSRSAVLRAQSSLLRTVYSMHSDSPPDLMENAASAMLHCTLAELSVNRQQQIDSMEKRAHEENVRCCYLIDVVISSSMGRPPSLESLIPDDLPSRACDAGNTDIDWRSSFTRSQLSEHVFGIRQIQARILKEVKRVQDEASRDEHVVPNLCKTRFARDLDIWRHDLSKYSVVWGEKMDGYHSIQWLLKIANYAEIALFPNPYLAVKSGDSRHLVAAATSVLETYRRFRVKHNISCWTWTALLHQFQAGVIVFYCLWATLPHQQPELYDKRTVSRAILACVGTMVEFGQRWKQARPLQDVFDLLSRVIPLTEFGDSTQGWSLCEDAEEATELMSLAVKLEKLPVQHLVVQLLRDMATQGRPASGVLSLEEQTWADYTD